MKIARSLVNVKEVNKEVWVATSPAEGRLQAFRFLDHVFGIQRPPLR